MSTEKNKYVYLKPQKFWIDGSLDHIIINLKIDDGTIVSFAIRFTRLTALFIKALNKKG